MRATKLRLEARAQSGDVDTDEADPDEPPEPIGIGGFPEGSPEGGLYGYVLAKWCCGGWDGADVGTLSYLVTRVGGRGLSQLSVNPSKRGMNQNRKIKKVFGDRRFVCVPYVLLCAGMDARQMEQPPSATIDTGAACSWTIRRYCGRVTGGVGQNRHSG